MEKVYHILKIAIGCVIGVFAGTSIYQCVDYSMHKDLYPSLEFLTIIF